MSSTSNTYVIKRTGEREEVDISKIQKRIKYLVNEPYPLYTINEFELSKNVIDKINSGIKTSTIDTYTADLAASLSVHNRDYLILAGRIVINNHHKKTLNSFSDKIELLYLRKDDNDVINPLIGNKFYKYVKKNKSKINRYIDYERDYLFDFFGFRTLEKGYLMRIKNKIIERPQDLIMRVAIQIAMPNELKYFNDQNYLDKIFHIYDRISNKYYTHATPTLFNSGTQQCNLSSCFLLGTEDSREGIMKTLDDCTEISKYAGGIGIHISNWRASGSTIRGTNGKSSGVVPFLRQFNDAARAFNQGGKRNGSFSVYIEPHHPDILKFLDLRKNVGDENQRCRDLFLAVWISDLFMERVKNDEKWSLFCPDMCPLLNDVYGKEYEELYLKYEKKGVMKEVINAREIWKAIFDSQKDSGLPYIGYKDNVNKSNMQSNLGVIRSSNLCHEIMLSSDSKEYACCNLASICLPKFVEDTWNTEELQLPEENRRVLNHEFPINPVMNLELLAKISGEITENINNVIDKNWNPTIETARSNFNHRPIGIGVQGLADVFMKFRISFESDKAKNLNKKIFEAIYYGALTKSTEISKQIYKNTYKEVLNLKKSNENNEENYETKENNTNEENNINEENKQKQYDFCLYPKDVFDDIVEKIYKPFNRKFLSNYNEFSEKDQKSLKNKIIGNLKKENVLHSFSSPEEIPKTIGTYPSYSYNSGSHIFNGKFHWEVFGLNKEKLSGLFDWETLRNHIKLYGVRNSVLCAAMPTASTAQIMGFSSCFEPYVSNIYKRTTLAGEYLVINKYLMKDLQDAGLWNNEIRTYLSLNNGSIQNIIGIPKNMKEIYKTIWEIKQSCIVNMAADRQPFIDQSQSMNLFMEEFTYERFHKIQFYIWKKHLKTGSYYVRTRPATKGNNFTISPEMKKKLELQEILKQQEKDKSSIEEEKEICLMCSA